MGTLRTLFALSVVFAHSYGFVFVGGRNAVQMFYMISGFLISYVLVETKSYPQIKDFYINRYLRLYPIYLAVALLTLVMLLLAKNNVFWDVYTKAPLLADCLLIFSNTFLFFQDWVMFLGVEDSHLVFARDFLHSDVLLFKGLLAPQAWTLGVELTFYLIAPWVLPRRKVIYVLLLLSIALRLFLVHIGLGEKDPWSYRFFPTELAFFLLGALAHQIFLPFYRKRLGERVNQWSTPATGFLIIFTVVFFKLPGDDLLKSAVLIAVFWVLMPLAFLYQNDNSLDKWIGDLSYPIYINHMLVIWVMHFFANALGLVDSIIISGICVVCSILFAIVLNQFIGVPVEKLRKKLRKNSTGTLEKLHA